MWTRFLRAFAIAAALGLGLCATLVLLVDPLGMSPVGIVPKSGYALSDPRFIAPQEISSGNFDSYIVGTSTIHSVDPQWAEEAFGGRFANVAMHGGTPYELQEMLRLIGHSEPRLIIFGLDANRWCRTDPPKQFNPKVVFPHWLFDESRVNDFSGLLNLEMVQLSLKQLEIAFGLKPAEAPLNGYRNRLIDTKWKPGNAKKRGDEHAARLALGWDEPDEAAESRADSKASYPALPLLQDTIDFIPLNTRLIAVLMPAHASTLPGDSAGRERLDECKRRIVDLVSRRNSYLVDFLLPSAWTTKDDNYWDHLHFRVGIARELIERLKEAVEGRRDADDGIYRVLATPPQPAKDLDAAPAAEDLPSRAPAIAE